MPFIISFFGIQSARRSLGVILLWTALVPSALSADPTSDEFMAVTATVTVLDVSALPLDKMEVFAVEHRYGLRASAITDPSGIAQLAIMPGIWTFIAAPAWDRLWDGSQAVGTGIYIVDEEVTVPQSPSFILTVQATDTVAVTFSSTIFDFHLGEQQLKLVAEPLGRYLGAPTVARSANDSVSLQTNAGLTVTAGIYSPRHGGPESLFFIEPDLYLASATSIDVTSTNTGLLSFEAHLPTGDPAKADIQLHSDSLSWAWSAVPFGLHDAWPQDIRVSAGGFQVLRAIHGSSTMFEPHLLLNDLFIDVEGAETVELPMGGPLVGPVVRTTPRPASGTRTQIMALFQDSYDNYVTQVNFSGQPMWPEFVVHHGSSTSAPFENFIFHAAGIWEQFPRAADPSYEITWDFSTWGSGSVSGPLYGQEERRMDNDEMPSLLGQAPRFDRQDRDMHLAEYEDLVQVMEQALGVPVDYRMGVISNVNWSGFEDEVQHGFKLEYGLELLRPWSNPAVGAMAWYANHEAGHGRTLLPPARFAAVYVYGESYSTLIALKAASMRFGGADYLRFQLGHHGYILDYRHGAPIGGPGDSIELMQFVTNYINENYGWLPHKRMILEWQNSFLPLRAALQANGYTAIEEFATIYSWLCGENLGALFEASGEAVTSARVSTGLGVIDTVISGFTEPALQFGVNEIRAPRFSTAVELQAPAGTELTSLSFTLAFDASQVVFEKAYRRDLTDSDGWVLSAVPGGGPGSLEVSLQGGSTSSPMGTVAQFNFRSLPDAAGSLAFALSDVVVAGDPKAPATGSYSMPGVPVIGPFPTLPIATPGESYSMSLWAVGGQPPYSWSVVEDSLPPGFSLDASSGELSGTGGSIGEFLFRVRCQDSGALQAHRWFTLKISLDTYQLTVDLAGAGSGTVTSVPSGIDCGSDCGEVFSEGTRVTLSATPEPGSLFAGWTGAPDCTDGYVTVNSDKNCTANFDLVSHLLTVAVDGTGTGVVFSDPPGIDCGLDCDEQYPFGTVVTLTPTPDGGSLFLGWFGDADCEDGQVTLDAGKTCIARFELAADVIFLDGFESGDVSIWSQSMP